MAPSLVLFDSPVPFYCAKNTQETSVFSVISKLGRHAVEKKSFSVRKRSHSVPTNLRRPTGSRSSKRKQWSEDNMAAALRSVEQGSSVTRASRNFGVPRSTLYDRVSGRVVHGVKPGLGLTLMTQRNWN